MILGSVRGVLISGTPRAARRRSPRSAIPRGTGFADTVTFFVTTIEFRPTLQAQRDDARDKGQIGRQKIFDGLLERLGSEAS
jgi:hypothetical protein